MRTYMMRFAVLLVTFGWMMGALAQTWDTAGPENEIEEVVVAGKRLNLGKPNLTPEEVLERATYARTLLSEVKLNFVIEKDRRTGGSYLRARPVIFAAQSAIDDSWHLITVEMPIPARTWVQGKPYTYFKVVTSGYRAEHVRGTGASLLMFRFFRGDEQLYVYGRKYPDIDRSLLAKRRFETMKTTVEVLYHVPYTPDMHYPALEERGRAFLETEARSALEELRTLRVPSFAYPGKLLADTVPYEALVSLAIIEQTDDYFYRLDRGEAMGEILNQYGVHGAVAYSNSVSSANAVGPMQFTDNGRWKRERDRKRRWTKRWLPGTYESIVRDCDEANLEHNFVKGAKDLHNAMKAAACLLDREMVPFRETDLSTAYNAAPAVLAVFAVSAYNGGQDDAVRLYRWLNSEGVPFLSIVPTHITSWAMPTDCPCIWVSRWGTTVAPKSLPHPSRKNKFNRENLWYVEKYLFVLGALFAQQSPP